MVELWPAQANARASTWPVTDRYFFRKLKLYAFNKKAAFEADHVAKEILAFDQEAFWDKNVVRELLFLLEDRWEEFSNENQCQLITRILTGPDQPSHLPDDKFPLWRDECAASYAQYLKLKCCSFPVECGDRLVEMIQNIPEWKDDWATSLTTTSGLQVNFHRADETTDVFNGIPLNEIVAKAMEALKTDSKHSWFHTETPPSRA